MKTLKFYYLLAHDWVLTHGKTLGLIFVLIVLLLMIRGCYTPTEKVAGYHDGPLTENEKAIQVLRDSNFSLTVQNDKLAIRYALDSIAHEKTLDSIRALSAVQLYSFFAKRYPEFKSGKTSGCRSVEIRRP